jgi:tetratricopeptide (TPR) repeat protein
MLRARILGNAGILCDARGERHRAVELYRQSIDIARAHDQPRDLGRALNNMGYAHQRLSEHDEALRCYEEALVALDRAGDVREQGTAHLHMAEIGLALGDVAMAREHCVQATRRYSRLGFDLGIADVDRVYAGIARKEGRWRVAERYLREALVVYGEHGDQLNIAETHEELGRLLEEVGEAGQAEEELLQSRTLFDMLRGSDVADPAP